MARQQPETAPDNNSQSPTQVNLSTLRETVEKRRLQRQDPIAEKKSKVANEIRNDPMMAMLIERFQLSVEQRQSAQKAIALSRDVIEHTVKQLSESELREVKEHARKAVYDVSPANHASLMKLELERDRTFSVNEMVDMYLVAVDRKQRGDLGKESDYDGRRLANLRCDVCEGWIRSLDANLPRKTAKPALNDALKVLIKNSGSVESVEVRPDER